jgi:DNA-binding transcriptional regulator YiaG
MNGEELREARKAAGISMVAAAELSGTPYRTWQDWERGRRRVPGIAVKWLALWVEVNRNQRKAGIEKSRPYL